MKKLIWHLFWTLGFVFALVILIEKMI